MNLIDEIKLRRLDLTVLLVFLNLMRLGKAIDVADHMGLTQSSISHALKRLRALFGDPLFLRHPKGMAPTAVALALEPKIRAVVQTLSEAVTTPAPFDPASSTEIIRIGAYDNEMTALVPGLLQRILRQAPGMGLSLLPLGRKQALQALDDRDIDLALGYIWDVPGRFRKVDLYEETYSVAYRQGHPLAGTALDLESYLQADHLVVSPAGDLSGIVDRQLAKLGKARRVRISVPQFLPALATIAATDLIATLPKRLVESQFRAYGLATAAPPLPIRPFTVSMIRHERDANAPLHAWLHSLLLTT